MKIVFVFVECVLWLKIGGFGDVVGSLSVEFVKRGYKVMMILLRYD